MNIWIKNNSIYKQAEDTIKIVNKLPNKVFILQYDKRTDELYLEGFADKFEFNFKIYGIESKLINHIMYTFEHTTNNLGILFSGVRGTGKTATAKLIANKMNLPVILINEPFNDLDAFIGKISHDCILFFDEFEKNFDREQSQKILSVMDGVFNNPYKRVFILTTNYLNINENFLSRPSRIRYCKKFTNLSKELIIDFLNDNLKDKSKIEEILQYIDTLEISTIDILKAVVEELNLHNCSINDFKEFFNIETKRYQYDFYYLVDDNCTIEDFKRMIKEDHEDIKYSNSSSSVPIYQLQAGDKFYDDVIKQPLDKDGISVLIDEYNTKTYIQILNPNYTPSLYNGNLI